jgi:hypothetical protein
VFANDKVLSVRAFGKKNELLRLTWLVPLLMCSKCEKTLGPYALSTPHPVAACPLLRSSYCSVCCSYGHFTDECPDEDVCENREVQYVEQLIPYSLLEQYSITTTTPIPKSSGVKKPRYDPVLEVIDRDKEIRQVLMDYEIVPSGKSKEIRKQLMRLANTIHRKLVFIKPN